MVEFPVVMFGLFLLGLWVLAKPASSSRNRQGEWWLEVRTDSPKSTHLYGPYNSREETIKKSTGHIKKLQNDGANEFKTEIIHNSQLTEITPSEES